MKSIYYEYLKIKQLNKYYKKLNSKTTTTQVLHNDNLTFSNNLNNTTINTLETISVTGSDKLNQEEQIIQDESKKKLKPLFELPPT
jgi:DICT domain-containing protein